MSQPFEFDPLDPNVMNDPGPAYSELRQRCPFYHYKGDQYDFYITSDYNEIKNEVMKNADVWSFNSATLRKTA